MEALQSCDLHGPGKDSNLLSNCSTSLLSPSSSPSASLLFFSIINTIIIIIRKNNCPAVWICWKNFTVSTIRVQTVSSIGLLHCFACGSCGSSWSHSVSQNNVEVAPLWLQMLHEFAWSIYKATQGTERNPWGTKFPWALFAFFFFKVI